MVNLILLLTGIPVLVLLYSQLKIKWQQEKFIKIETESLKQLKELNQRFITTDLFGLSPNCPYLQTSISTPKLMNHRKEVLTRKSRRNSTNKEYQIY